MLHFQNVAAHLLLLEYTFVSMRPPQVTVSIMLASHDQLSTTDLDVDDVSTSVVLLYWFSLGGAPVFVFPSFHVSLISGLLHVTPFHI